MHAKERYRLARNVTLIGSCVTALLGCLKVLGGIVFHSHALTADGIHSFADLLTDIMVLFASKYGSQDADETHPYGHQRIETAATLILALLLILAGAGIAWDSGIEIIRKTHDTPTISALWIVIISIIANELLFQFTHAIGKRIQSALIIANAWHHRSDAASSVVVLLGLIGSLLGFTYLDAGAAIVVGLMIMHMGVSYGRNSVLELVDSAVAPQLLNTIETKILMVEGVKKIHQLRSRSMGKDVYVDVHVQVAPTISVSEGHYIAQQVHHTLIDDIAVVTDVTVHVDPEDDESECPSYSLPTRAQLEAQFLHSWQQTFPTIQSWTLHYLQGKLFIELICSDASQVNAKVLEHDLKDHADLILLRILQDMGK